MKKKEVIIDAIERGKNLHFFYNNKWRMVTPHKFGVKHTDNGDSFRVFGMQYDGRSHDGELIEGKWRCFKVDDCKNVRARIDDGVFHTEMTQGLPNWCMDVVITAADS